MLCHYRSFLCFDVLIANAVNFESYIAININKTSVTYAFNNYLHDNVPRNEMIKKYRNFICIVTNCYVIMLYLIV